MDAFHQSYHFHFLEIVLVYQQFVELFTIYLFIKSWAKFLTTFKLINNSEGFRI